jgi:chromosome segregation ATPase
MADVITRLKVDSSEYDSKLKRATQGLQHMEEALHRAGKSFIDADKWQVEFVRQLGQMGTVSTTAKGKIGEMSQAFVELSLQYKRMSEQEKSSPIGKALSESLDQLKGRIGEAKQQLSDVNAEMGKTTQEGSDMSGMLGMLAAKFGVSTQVLTAFGAVVGG